MARVYPRTDAFRILQLTEEVENLPDTATYIAAMALFLGRVEPPTIAASVFVTQTIYSAVQTFGLFIPAFTGMLPVARVYNLLAGRGILLTALLIIGALTSGSCTDSCRAAGNAMTIAVMAPWPWGRTRDMLPLACGGNARR